MRSTKRNTKRSGFSMIELLIGMALATILAMSATMAAGESYVAFRTTSQNSALEANIRRAMDRVVRELMATSFGVVTPTNLDDQFGASDVVFQTAADIDGDDIVWGPPARLAFQYEDGEIDDGADNNGNGLVDEGVLVFTRSDGMPNETSIILCHDVSEMLEGELLDGDDTNGNGVTDEAGFNVHREGEILTIRLTLEEPSEQAGVVTRTLTASIRLRN